MTDEKKLKLNWTVHETIGPAIVNARGIAQGSSSAIVGSSYIPPIYSRRFNISRFDSETGSIRISPYCIEIFGELNGAAYALAKDILSHKFPYNPNEGINYSDAIVVKRDGSKFYLELGPTGQGIFNPDLWPIFKARVEKLCNDLSAFW